MRNALHLLCCAVAGFAVGWLIGALLNAICALLVAVFGQVIGTALGFAMCFVLCFFGMTAVLRSIQRRHAIPVVSAYLAR